MHQYIRRLSEVLLTPTPPLTLYTPTVIFQSGVGTKVSQHISKGFVRDFTSAAGTYIMQEYQVFEPHTVCMKFLFQFGNRRLANVLSEPYTRSK